MENDELVGLSEIADLAGVSRSAVANWRAKESSQFPKPVAELKSGPVFLRNQVRKWLRRKKIRMPFITSIINLKGGVGKSTTTVVLAEMLNAEFGKSVLVTDLDPQTNATVMLMGEEKWLEANDKGHTLARLFEDALEEDESKRTFDSEEAVQVGVSNVQAVDSVDLLASSIDLMDVQDRLAAMPSGRFYSDVPTDILRRAIKPLLEEKDYDYVLIDCPPNLGIITMNGLRISNGYIIPVIPDVLSTYGVPQIIKRVGRFAKRIAEDIEPLGILVSKYDSRSSVHNNTIPRLNKYKSVPLFKTIIRQSNQIAASAEFLPVNTLRQKYGYQGQFDDYYALAKEFIEATTPEVASV